MTNAVIKKNAYDILTSLDDTMKKRIIGRSVEQLIALYFNGTIDNDPKINFQSSDNKQALEAMLSFVNKKKKLALEFSERFTLGHLGISYDKVNFKNVNNKALLVDAVINESGLFSDSVLSSIDELFDGVIEKKYAPLLPGVVNLQDSVNKYRFGTSGLDLSKSKVDLKVGVLHGGNNVLGLIIEKEKTMESILAKIMPHLFKADFDDSHFIYNDSYGFALIFNETINYTKEGFEKSDLANLLFMLSNDVNLDLKYKNNNFEDNFYLNHGPVAGFQAYLSPSKRILLSETEELISGNGALAISFHGFCLASYIAGFFGLFHKAHSIYKKAGSDALDVLEKSHPLTFIDFNDGTKELLSNASNNYS